ncbi:MAG TPA: Stk1 family PASTA domain-containing Ser/Thr kinase [Acidimicrobiia bacterium]|jgi:serine/threonine-protein kinase
MDLPRPLTDRYHLTAHIARGGMADVYQGMDTLLKRKVAIKVLHSQFSQDEAFIRRFRREAQAAANLSHPNIVSIYDWGEVEGTYFIVMELIEGRSLRDLLRAEGALLPQRAAEIASDVASALEAAHTAGLIHRDIKPGNIIITPTGGVKVGDFGIVRAWDDSSDLTRTGAVIGTATYFSPEQAQGHTADARSDLYALGVVLYEMLAGRPPFTGESPVAVAYQHVSANPPVPSASNPDVPASLDSVVARALQKTPELRYQSAAEFQADLERILRGEVPAAVTMQGAALMVAANGGGPARTDSTQVMTATRPPVLPPRDEEPGRRNFGFMVATLALLLLLGGLVYLVFQLASERNPGAESVVIPNVVGQPRDDALAQLSGLGLQVRLTEVVSDTVDPLLVISTNPPAGQTVEKGTAVEVVVSLGEEAVPAPNVVGETQQDAERLVREAGFTIGQVTTRPDGDSAEGIVLEQNPGPNVPAAKGSDIDLVVSSGPEELEMPDLVEMSERDATALLNTMGLRWTITNAHSENAPVGEVLATTPEAGIPVNAGDTVELVVSDGPAPVKVPDLFGRTVNAAQSVLEDAGLEMNISQSTIDVADPSLDGRIVYQFPTAGTEVTPGSPVTVTLADYVPPPTTTTTTTTTTTQPPPTTNN